MKFSLALLSPVAASLVLCFAAPIAVAQGSPDGDVLSPAPGVPYVSGERIERYDVDLHLRSDSVLEVRETIVHNFADVPNKHGIFRDIPLTVGGEGGKRKIRLHFGDVRDETGNSYEVKTSIVNGMLRKQIGSAGTIVSGKHTYVITYTVDRALVAAEDRPEAKRPEGDLLLWNAIGTGWPFHILGGTTTLTIDGVAEPKVTCLTGREGSAAGSDCAVSSAGGVTSVRLTRALGIAEGLTMTATFPSGVIVPPSAVRRFLWSAQEHWGVGVLVLTAIVLAGLYIRKGIDPRGRSTVIAEYDAPVGLTPAEVGTLMDEKVHDEDLTATIVDLAARGFLKIRPIADSATSKPEDYVFDRSESPWENLKPHELTLLSRLFLDGPSVSLSSLRQNMSSTWQEMRNGLYRSLTTEGYFLSNPLVIRNTAYTIGVIVTIIAFPAAILGTTTYSSYLTAACIALSGILIMLFARALPARTLKGVEALRYSQGLRRYLSIAETERLKFEEAEQRYSKLLPYALAMGVAALWSKRFEGLLRKAPDWYSGPAGGSFSPLMFAHSMNTFSSKTSAAMSAPAPSSSGSGGGGGVGGGGGGGGGGSW